MPTTFINDEEDHALDYLPHEARTLYVQVFRRYMDYKTGIVGLTYMISRKKIMESLEVRNKPGSKRGRVEVYTWDQCKTLLRRLIDRGLIVRVAGYLDTVVYRLPLATSDCSDPTRIAPRPPPDRPPSTAPMTAPGETSGDAGIEDMIAPVSAPGAPPETDERSAPHPLSVYPSTTKHHHQSETVDDSDGVDDDGSGNVVSTRAGKLAKLLRDAGVDCTSQHPTLLEWVEAGVTIDQASEWIDVARVYKPKPQRIAINYLNTIRNNQQAQQHQQSMRLPRDDAELQSWARKLELPDAKVGESKGQYRRRLTDLVAKRNHQREVTA